MAQEFTIKSQAIEDKINQLLPSQGGFQAGVDFSASTMVIPIVDLTESAEGSSLRQDLQTSLSLTSNSAFSVNNTTTTIISTTGYFRLIGTATQETNGVFQEGSINLTDGITTKKIYALKGFRTSGNANPIAVPFDFIVFINAGDSCTITSDSATCFMGSSRQIADINGNLVNPL